MHKLRYLQELLLRREEENANDYIITLMKLKDRARRCYAEEIRLSEDDFVEMLCLDGLFIIEFLRKLHMEELQNSDDKIFQMDWLLNSILSDLILFENQIPFFILVELFDMTKTPGQDDLAELAYPLSDVPYDIIPRWTYASIFPIPPNEVAHLLDLVHKIWSLTFAINPVSHPYFAINDPKDRRPLKIIKPASELGHSGIKFESAEEHALWHHISFKNGKIKIPHLTIDDHYARFLDHLIESPRDVEILRRCNIITNRTGNDQFVATMFNKLTLDITVWDSKFCYLRVYKEVNEYSDKRCNRCKARYVIWVDQLMKNYFSSPWSIISFLAAVVLLILTAVQTTLSILAVSKGK